MTTAPSKIPPRFFTLPMPDDNTFDTFEEFSETLLTWAHDNIGQGNYMARVYLDNRVVFFIPDEKYCVFLKLRWSAYIERE